MARGIGSRQKKVVTAKRVWVKPSFSLSPRERDGVKAPKQPKRKLNAGRQRRPHPNLLPEGEGT